MAIRPSAFASRLVKLTLGPHSLRRRAGRQLRRLLLRFWRAPYEAEFFGRRLIFPAQHDLIQLTNDVPLFNTPFRRLAQSVRANHQGLRLVDIGANVGEAPALLDAEPTDKFWLIEGSQSFLPFLRENVRPYNNVVVFETYLSDKPSRASGREIVSGGNAYLVSSQHGEIAFETLDRLFEGSSLQPNLIKIDVEGHEPRILRGGEKFFSEYRPIIFMEWHPSLLVSEGFNTLSSIEPLVEAGYQQALLYDNHGYLIGEFALSERDHLVQLARYAQSREEYHYDLAVFAPEHESVRKTFLASEGSFYKALSHELNTFV